MKTRGKNPEQVDRLEAYLQNLIGNKELEQALLERDDVIVLSKWALFPESLSHLARRYFLGHDVTLSGEEKYGLFHFVKGPNPFFMSEPLTSVREVNAHETAVGIMDYGKSQKYVEKKVKRAMKKYGVNPVPSTQEPALKI